VTFELVPQKLVYGGAALGHYQGRPVLVPRALPRERWEVEEVRRAKGVLHARPLRILSAAPERVDPPCPYFGRCGGCQYQHLRAEYQLATKREILRETLRRIGKIPWDAEIPVHTAPPWSYRNQAQLKVGRLPDGQVALGFFEAESHRLFPVDVCLILSPRLNGILRELRGAEWASRLGGCREVELLADDRDEHVLLTLRGEMNPREGEALADDMLARLDGVAGVAVESRQGWHTFGRATIEYTVGDFRYRISPGSFFQASRFLLPALVTAVVREESGSPVAAVSDRTLALDLFAGVGLFTLPLARRFAAVVAIEIQPRSTADLRANAEAYILPNIRVVQATAFDFLRRFAQAEPDLVLLDPPRAGAGAGALSLLAGLRPKRIHYVSCSPPTLARDLGYLVKRGYRLNSVELFDFFPQTFHIECLARLSRNGGASR